MREGADAGRACLDLWHGRSLLCLPGRLLSSCKDAARQKWFTSEAELEDLRVLVSAVRVCAG